MSKIFFLNILFLTFSSFALIPPKRISLKTVDLGKVHPIYMTSGMVTIIEIPGPITGIRIGNPNDIQYFIPEKPQNEVTLVLKNANAEPTNFIIRSGKRKYVFDIIPSKSVHQDSIEIIGAYGGPEIEDLKMKLIDSSELEEKKQ